MKSSNYRIYVTCIVLMCTCCTLSSCSRKSDHSQKNTSGKPVVYTVNYPLAYFAERIGGDYLEIKYPMPDEDPAYWKPDTETLHQYQQADLILQNGADYAKWMDTVSLPPSKCVNTSSAVSDRYIELDKAITHSHGLTGAHAHAGLAFTVWLDFSIAAQQAKAIEVAFIKISPENEADFKTNYGALEEDLIKLDNTMRAIAAKIKDTPLVVSHPVYQYWTKAYGLNTRSVHWEPDALPNDEQWTEFKEMLKTHPAKWMIWENEPIPETVQKLSEMQIRSVVFDPCGGEPSDQNFLYSMQANLENLEPIQ